MVAIEPPGEPSPFRVGRWRGRWVWPAGDAPDRVQVAGLRRTVRLDAVPAAALARMTAESRYWLWVNGVEVGRGPARHHPRQRRYDVVDLAPFLAIGDNEIAVLSWTYAHAVANWYPLPSMVRTFPAGGGFLFEAALGDELLVTDESWRGRFLDGWQTSGAPGHRLGSQLERHDLRVLPEGWRVDPADGDDGWQPVALLHAMATGEPGRPEAPSDAYGPIGPWPASPTGRDTVELRPADDGTWTTGRIVAGTVEVELEGPAGAEVEVVAGEFFDEHGALAAGQEAVGLVVTLDGGRRTVESLDLYGGVGVRVDAPDGVTVQRVAVNERLYPVRVGAFFECSDPLLNRIWEVGRRTVSLCSFDAYVDCPTRERRAWTGDAVVHQMVDLTTNEDWGLARWSPRLAATPRGDGMLPMAVAGDVEFSDVTVIPDWALHWVHALWNLHRYVGDPEELRPLVAVAEGVLRWFDPWVGGDGVLVDVPGWTIIDWASVYTEGRCAALNGLWGRALLEFAEVAAWLGDDGRAGWARRVHERLRIGFEVLWDQARGRYADHVTAEGLQAPSSQHAQAAAIVGGLAPEDRWSRLVEVLTDESALVHATFSVVDGPASPGAGYAPATPYNYLDIGHPAPWWDVDTQVVRAQPFFRYVVHDAVVAAGRADLIPALCRDWRMALDRCDTSWTEAWFGGTVCHGWSSTPTRDLMQRVLGVVPAEPGFAVAAVEPELGDLQWARGAVPTPAGLLHVDVRPDRVEVASPVPFTHAGTRHDPGTHTVPR